jgi:hypothetical protein
MFVAVNGDGAKGTYVAQPLRFGQICFAPAQPVFGLLGFIDVDRQAVPLDDASLLISQRLATGMVPTVLAVCSAHTEHSLVGRG